MTSRDRRRQRRRRAKRLEAWRVKRAALLQRFRWLVELSLVTGPSDTVGDAMLYGARRFGKSRLSW